MLEYLNFCLPCALFAYLYIRMKRYLPLLKMAEELIGNLGYGAPQSDTKHQKLLECVLTGNSKLYLVKSLGRSIINMHSVGACAVLGITNQDTLRL